MRTKIDVTRCRRAMIGLSVSGNPHIGGEAPSAIDDAIAAILADGTKALADGYIGVKIYSGFGPQRSDHPYGYGPSHGSIVFRIERTDRAASKQQTLGADHVYLLECVRDFGGYKARTASAQTETLNLCTVIRDLDALEAHAAALRAAVEAATVESHEAVPA